MSFESISNVNDNQVVCGWCTTNKPVGIGNTVVVEDCFEPWYYQDGLVNACRCPTTAIVAGNLNDEPGPVDAILCDHVGTARKDSVGGSIESGAVGITRAPSFATWALLGSITFLEGGAVPLIFGAGACFHIVL